MFGDEKDKIEELKKTLYSRQNFKSDNPVHNLPQKTYEVSNAWTPPVETIKRNRKHWSLVKILIWFSIIFFLVAVGIAGYVYYNGYNTISADNVNIGITGPTTVDAGRDATIALAIDNKNQLDLQDAVLNIEYPNGARRDSSQTEPLVQNRISLGTVVSGGHLDRTVSAAFFGLEGSQEKVKITLEYHVLGSTNLFAKTKDYVFTLGAGPVSLTITHVDKINSGQDVSFKVVVTSNSTETLSSIALSAAYPFGFTFKSAVPAASLGNTVWQLGDFAPGDSKTVTIVGKLEGQENEQRAFKFNVGITNPADARQIATVFYAGTETVAIQKPFIGIDMAFDENTVETYPVYAGKTVNVTVSYSNNMAVPLTDGVISAKLDGAILDKGSVLSATGFYQSVGSTITWDKRTIPALASLSPGDHGLVQFTFKTLPFVAGSSYTKSSQKIGITTSVNATQVSSDGSTPISSAIARSVVVNSNIALTANAFYNGGQFKNTGLIPPKAEKSTTYTINWVISNTFNNTSNVTVAAVLPSNVKFLNNISPQNEAVTYNEVSGEVDWNVGNIKTNTGYVSAPRQVSFQVSLLPSLTQVGTAPLLIGDSTLKATDVFTGAALSAAANALTTDIVNDPQYQYGVGIVVK
jgi:hypothetical protein